MLLEDMFIGENMSRQEDEASELIATHSPKKWRQDFTPDDSPGLSAVYNASRPVYTKGLIHKLIAALRLPRSPEDDYQIVVRPKECMDVRKLSRLKLTQAVMMAACLEPPQAQENILCAKKTHNNFVISMPHAKNPEYYAKVMRIRVGEKLHDVKIYVPPPGDTCRGVVLSIHSDLSDDWIAEIFVHVTKPKVLGVWRIKQTADGNRTLRPNETSKLRHVLDDHDLADPLPTTDRRLSNLQKAGASLGRSSHFYCHHLPEL
ncbi:hypothetical protein HPB51_019333 [Rhipicephalus microplus]|uniref:Uncharacterized protein n=1 Tax=Rhipicephalus microplus TaxID=6941 RepID=A0A9J6DBE8_RHIMP|nr:hypothetical protein HPB51_019333 [Rhipicephalus microplus]